MFCKYCGNEIADDSIFCAKCGKNVQQKQSTSLEENLNESNSDSIKVQLIANEKSEWTVTTNMQWAKPIVARIIQGILLCGGLFFLVYGVVWSAIIEDKVDTNNPTSFPTFGDFRASAYEPFEIVDIIVDLERDDPNYSTYKAEWENSEQKRKIDYKERERYESVLRVFSQRWGISYETLSRRYYDKSETPGLSLDQRIQISRAIEAQRPLVISIPYDYIKYSSIAEEMAVSRFRKQVLLKIIIPSLAIILLSILWVIIITPSKDKKNILPRDYADKIENYTWIGFSTHKYVRFMKNEKYGILDAVTRRVIVPATFDLIEWRQANKSYDGVLDGIRKTYDLITTK